MKKSREGRDWEQYYQEEEVESMPWFHPRLDHDLENALARFNIRSAAVLDLGTGPGTQAIALAKMGFQVTATDVSKTAVAKARARSLQKGVSVHFVHDDILKTGLEREFDFVFDRGCFHVLEPHDRPTYVETVHDLIRPEGFLFLKCFSRLEPGEEGPNRFSPHEIREQFQSSFRVESVKESKFMGNRRPYPRALFCLIQRV
ncbi:MAG: class I SAM-dependent methyltransferase [Candidatus Neomarinimicrobiota bacterium]